MSLMAVMDYRSFVSLLEKSHLLSAGQLAKLQRVVMEPKILARTLVQQKWLTAWQAQQLLAGRHTLFLGKYKLLDKLGEGGMGAVYRAEQAPLGRIVALKVMSEKVLRDPGALARFHREIRAASALSHPHIVAALDADQVGNTHFLVMEYAPGRDLKQWIKEYGTLPVDWSCECIRQAALGLQHAHERGLAHRDIKPANLLVISDEESGAPLVKILDLGIARFTGEEHHTALTSTGQVLGTIDYIAPEQAQDTKGAGIQADIYSLGATLFQLVTGRVPFPGDNPLEKLMARAQREAPRARTVRPDLPGGLDNILAKMLARKPEARYQTPAEVAQALGPFCLGADDQPSTSLSLPDLSVEPVIDSAADETLNNFVTSLDDHSSGDSDSSVHLVTGPSSFAARGASGIGRRLSGVTRGPSGEFSLVQGVPQSWLIGAGVAVLLLMAGLGAYGLGLFDSTPANSGKKQPNRQSWSSITSHPMETVSGTSPAPVEPVATSVPPNPSVPVGAASDPAAARDREIAQWTLNRGGTVIVNFEPVPRIRVDLVKPGQKLPQTWFRVIGLDFLTTRAPLRGEDLSSLLGGTEINTLGLFGPDLTDDGIARLASLSKLMFLNFQEVRLNGTSLPRIANLSGISFQDCDLLNPTILESLSQCSRLQTIQLRHCKLPREGWNKLAQRGLYLLDLSESNVLSEDLRSLQGIPQLNSLSIQRTPVDSLLPIIYLPVKNLTCDQELARQFLPALQSVKSLTTINGQNRDAYLKTLADVRPAPPALPPPPPVATSNTHELAKWILEQKGQLVVKPGGAPTPIPVAKLAELPSGNYEIQAVLFENAPHITDADLLKLTPLTNTSDIQLFGTRVTDAGVAELRKKLYKCRIAVRDSLPPLTAPGMTRDREVAQFVLDKGGRGLLQAGDAPRQFLPKQSLPAGDFRLVSIIFEPGKAALVDDDLAKLTGDLGLYTLTVTGPALTDAGLKHLAGLKRLMNLQILNANVTGSGLADLRGLAGLSSVTFHQCSQLTSAALENAAQLPELKSLQLTDCQVPHSGWNKLVGLQLDSLLLQGSNVTTEDLQALVGIPRLDYLSLEKTTVPSLQPLAALPVKNIWCDEALAIRSAELLRSHKTLVTVNGLPRDEFLKKVAVLRPNSAANPVAPGLPPVATSELPFPASFDGFALLDPPRDTVKGTGAFQDGKLNVTAPAKANSILTIPYRPPHNYNVELVVERKGGEDAFATLLTMKQFPFGLIVDGWKGQVSGLGVLDGKEADQNETRSRGGVLPLNVPRALSIRVRPAEVLVLAGDQQLIHYKGSADRFAGLELSADMNPRLLSFHAVNSSFRVHSLQFQPLLSFGEIELLAMQGLPREPTDPAGTVWKRDGHTALLGTGFPNRNVAMFSVAWELPPEYDLHVTAERLQGTNELIVGLPDFAGTRQTLHLGGGVTGTVHGLNIHDSKDWNTGLRDKSVALRAIFAPNVPVSFVCQVRESGLTVLASLDEGPDRKTVELLTSIKATRPAPRFTPTPQPRSLQLGVVRSDFRITRLALVPGRMIGRRLSP